MRLPWSQLVFVAGHPRGGTTWLGAVLGEAGEASYVFEPQLVERHPRTSFSRRVAEYNELPRWWLSPEEEDLEPHRRALVGHLGELIEAYFDRREVDTLVIKIPETERLPWLLRSLSADRLVYIRRHPLGVLNSFDKARLYWAVRRKWELMLRDVGERFPELLELVRPAGEGDLERTAATIHLRYRLLESSILQGDGGPPTRVVDYERLAAEPRSGYRELFDWLGWRWTEELAARLEPYFRPAVEKEGFFEVEKESQKRIHAWRRELAPWQIRRAAGYFAAVGATYPVPGAGLPELTRREKLAAVGSFVDRRARRVFRWVEGKLRAPFT